LTNGRLQQTQTGNYVDKQQTPANLERKLRRGTAESCKPERKPSGKKQIPANQRGNQVEKSRFQQTQRGNY
jgi:hypothetical protein